MGNETWLDGAEVDAENLGLWIHVCEVDGLDGGMLGVGNEAKRRKGAKGNSPIFLSQSRRLLHGARSSLLEWKRGTAFRRTLLRIDGVGGLVDQALCRRWEMHMRHPK